MRKNKILVLQSFLAIGFLGVSVETGFAAGPPAMTLKDELAARAQLRSTGSKAAQEIQASAAAAPMMRGAPPSSSPGQMLMQRGTVPPPPPLPMNKGFGSAPTGSLGQMGMNMRAKMDGLAAPISGLRPTDAKAALQSAAPMMRGTPPPPPSTSMNKGFGSAPVEALGRMGGLPPMNMRAQMEGRAAPISGLRPTDAKAALQSAVPPMNRGMPSFPSQMPMNKALGSAPVEALGRMGGLPPMNMRAPMDGLAAAKAGLRPTDSKAAQEIAAAKAAAQSAAPMKRGLPPLPPQMSGMSLPKMNVGSYVDQLNAAKANLRPTPMGIGTPPVLPGRAVMGAGGKLVKAQVPQDEFGIEDEAAKAQEEAQPSAAAKKKGFYGSMTSAMQKAASIAKKQFTGKCIPGHIPESEEERIACQSNARRFAGAVRQNVAPSKGFEGETAEEREVRIASENPMQQATRQMREQAMMAAGQMAVAGTAAVTARTQQGIDKATGAMTKQIAKIAPKPKAPVVAPPVVMEEEFVLEDPSVQEEASALEGQLGTDEFGMDTGAEGVDPSAYAPDQGGAEQEETEPVENVDLGGESDPYASAADPSQEEYQGNPYDMAGEVTAH